MASRLIGAYMCCYAIGSGLGAVVATWVYARWGWLAVCGLGASISALALGYCVCLEIGGSVKRDMAAKAAMSGGDQNL